MKKSKKIFISLGMAAAIVAGTCIAALADTNTTLNMNNYSSSTSTSKGTYILRNTSAVTNVYMTLAMNVGSLKKTYACSANNTSETGLFMVSAPTYGICTADGFARCNLPYMPYSFSANDSN